MDVMGECSGVTVPHEQKRSDCFAREMAANFQERARRCVGVHEVAQPPKHQLLVQAKV